MVDVENASEEAISLQQSIPFVGEKLFEQFKKSKQVLSFSLSLSLSLSCAQRWLQTWMIASICTATLQDETWSHETSNDMLERTSPESSTLHTRDLCMHHK